MIQAVSSVYCTTSSIKVVMPRRVTRGWLVLYVGIKTVVCKRSDLDLAVCGVVCG